MSRAAVDPRSPAQAEADRVWDLVRGQASKLRRLGRQIPEFDGAADELLREAAVALEGVLQRRFPERNSGRGMPS